MDRRRIPNELILALESISCLEHRAKPAIKLSENTIVLNCCCDGFFSDCVSVTKELSEILEVTEFEVKKGRRTNVC
jgi:hypothetical protein